MKKSKKVNPASGKNVANLAVLASGNGSNFAAIAEAIKRDCLKARIKLLITDNEIAFVRLRARKLKIKDVFINPKDFKSRFCFDKKIAEILIREEINFVVLAGYMRILSPYLVKKFKNRILNIHPAILPAFKGEGAIKRAFEYGCKLTGVTVHFVDEEVDHGPVILQDSLQIKPDMSLRTLEKKIHNLEHKLYPQALKIILEKKVRIHKRNVKIS